jgi:hypothetical protein
MEILPVKLTLLPFISYCCWQLRITPDGRTLVTKPHVGYSIAPVVSLDTNHANAFVTAAAENFWTRFDHREMHDVFIVISEGRDGEHIARTVYAASEDDARQTHRENYAGEPIVEVQQETIPASDI